MGDGLDINDDRAWNNDALQFAVIITYLRLAGSFDQEVVSGMAEELGLEPEHIAELLVRASAVLVKFSVEQRALENGTPQL